jgi:predicted lipid carrier protein YhbT
MLNDRSDQASPAVDPPFSPVLLAGLALAPLPPGLLQPLVDGCLALLLRRYPDLLDRLSEYPESVVGLDPVDLPIVLVLEPKPGSPKLTVCRDFSRAAPTAVVRGPLAMLIALAEGRLDGDAAFFARDLVYEGDTEVVLALRNAVDGSAIDIRGELAALAGPLARPLLWASGIGGRLFEHMTQNMERMRTALLSPAMRSAGAQAARIEELEAEVGALRRSLNQRKTPT